MGDNSPGKPGKVQEFDVSIFFVFDWYVLSAEWHAWTAPLKSSQRLWSHPTCWHYIIRLLLLLLLLLLFVVYMAKQLRYWPLHVFEYNIERDKFSLCTSLNGKLIIVQYHCIVIIKGLKVRTALHRNSASELWGVTCHVGSHNVTCHPIQVNVPRLYHSQ